MSSYGNVAIIGFFVECLVYFHVLHLCFCKPWVDFCSCKGDNNRDGLKTLVVCTFTNFEFVGVAWAHARAITASYYGFVDFYNPSQRNLCYF